MATPPPPPPPPKPRSIYAEKLGEYPDVIFPDTAAKARQGAWAELFRERIGTAFSGQIILDVGCFDAGYLSEIAIGHPTIGFIGIDWKYKAIYDGGNRISGLQQKNIILIHGRGNEISDFFHTRELDEIWVLHPDPCDQPHELKNRLINERFLAVALSLLRSGGLLTLKTDHAGYYQWAADALARTPRFELITASNDFWNDPVALAHTAHRPYAGHRTLFETRFIRRKQPIYFLHAVRPKI